MSYVVKEKDHYIVFDRFVRGMNIITTTDSVYNIDIASEFDDEELTKRIIKEAEKSNCDISDYTICDKQIEQENIKKEAEANAKLLLKEQWEKLTHKEKRKKLKEILDKNGPKAVEKWLNDVDDHSGIQPADDLESPMMTTLYENMEKILGRSLTDTEKKDLMKGVK